MLTQYDNATQATVSPLNLLHRKPQRISITLSYSIYCELIRVSDLQGRSLSNLAAFLLEQSVRTS